MSRLMARRLFLVFSFMALPVFMTNTSSAGVENTWPGAEGGTIQALAIDPNLPRPIYAGTEVGGVFTSTDDGSTWSAVNNGITNFNVQAVAINPDFNSTVYAGTSGGGVFKTNNSGGSWTAVNGVAPDDDLDNLDVQALAINPLTPSTLYAGTAGGGVFRSDNSGG